MKEPRAFALILGLRLPPKIMKIKKKTSDTVNRKNSFENKFFFKILKGLGMLYKPKKSFWLLNIFMLIN